jgi:hypothetical protein
LHFREKACGEALLKMTVAEIKELVLSRGVFAESTLYKLKKSSKLRKAMSMNFQQSYFENFFVVKKPISGKRKQKINQSTLRKATNMNVPCLLFV